mmetsp:Transcript_81751/g.213268  ORF Transcript_81751/g.213268 Transcript_81751/m.213268 type:complete len:263 (-) Transcript_81751:613-1401(-)
MPCGTLLKIADALPELRVLAELALATGRNGRAVPEEHAETGAPVEGLGHHIVDIASEQAVDPPQGRPHQLVHPLLPPLLELLPQPAAPCQAGRAAAAARRQDRGQAVEVAARSRRRAAARPAQLLQRTLDGVRGQVVVHGVQRGVSRGQTGPWPELQDPGEAATARAVLEVGSDLPIIRAGEPHAELPHRLPHLGMLLVWPREHRPLGAVLASDGKGRDEREGVVGMLSQSSCSEVQVLLQQHLRVEAPRNEKPRHGGISRP